MNSSKRVVWRRLLISSVAVSVASSTRLIAVTNVDTVVTELLSSSIKCKDFPATSSITKQTVYSLPVPLSISGFQTSIRFFAETVRGTCNLLGQTDVNGKLQTGCQRIVNGESDSPDAFIVDALGSLLAECQSRRCEVLDIGSNLGLLTLHALNLGAYVTAIEPQIDLLCAMRESARANGFHRRLKSHWGVLVHSTKTDQFSIESKLYRYGGPVDVLSLYKSLNLPTQVPSILTKDLFRRNSAHYDFVKIDTDSIDCSIVNQLLHAMELNLVSFSAVSFEIWTGEECEDMNLGYIIFALQQN